MKRFIITTLILLAATVLITVAYFKNLNTAGVQTSRLMHHIPDNAALIFEFNNDNSFYDIFNNNQLFADLAGKQTLTELDTLRRQILLNPVLEHYFSGQNIFISVHPLNNGQIGLLLTISVAKGFPVNAFDELAKHPDTRLVITPIAVNDKKGYTVYSSILKKRFFLFSNDDGIFSGSFSKALLEQAAGYEPKKNKAAFVLLPDQQSANSLANLYINYSQLQPMFLQFFQNKNTDIFKIFRASHGFASLSLDFKNDALMFSGFTSIEKGQSPTYLDIFKNQQPVVNQLKDIFPSTTAYSVNFAVSDIAKFNNDLSVLQTAAGLQPEKDELLKKIKTETGINLTKQFSELLGNEFAIVTTRYQEKIAIITVKDGLKLQAIFNNISLLINENTGQLNYNKLPFFLLGNEFAIFKHPYFMIIDNYLVLANSNGEIASYRDSYTKRKFLSKIDQYNQFNNLLAERSNVNYFVNFKNIAALLKTDLNPYFNNIFENGDPGWKNFYAASYQLVATDKNNFYTNFCMRLNLSDSTAIKPNISR